MFQQTSISRKEYCEIVSKNASKLLNCKRFEVFDENKMSFDIKRIIDKYFSNEVYKDGIGFYFWSNSPGSGKTITTNYIANKFISIGFTVYFNSLIDIKNDLKKEFDTNSRILIDKIKEFDVVAIDDIGCETKSDWLSEVIKSIVDDRYNNMKILIITSNFELNKNEIFNDKICDRLRSILIQVHFPEKSFRSLV